MSAPNSSLKLKIKIKIPLNGHLYRPPKYPPHGHAFIGHPNTLLMATLSLATQIPSSWPRFHWLPKYPPHGHVFIGYPNTPLMATLSLATQIPSSWPRFHWLPKYPPHWPRFHWPPKFNTNKYENLEFQSKEFIRKSGDFQFFFVGGK